MAGGYLGKFISSLNPGEPFCLFREAKRAAKIIQHN
jgi:hypothetical protein